MRARAAYISSLTTTSIMLASTVLMLVVFGALVGFKRWPAGDGGSPADPIGLGGTQTPLSTAPASFTRAIPPAPLPRTPIVKIAPPVRIAAGTSRPGSTVAAPAPSQATGGVVVTPAPAIRQGPSSSSVTAPGPTPSTPDPIPSPPKGPPGPLGQATGIVTQVVEPAVPPLQAAPGAVASTVPHLEQALGIGGQLPVGSG